MKTMSVSEFKARFSDVLKQVKESETIAVTSGRNKRWLVILPANYPKGPNVN
jgi:prevent-host-death family protein